jgi:hypothetical protein
MVIELRPTRSTLQWQLTSSPTKTGRWNVIAVIATLAREIAAGEIHLREQPAAEDVAVGIGVGRHGDRTQAQGAGGSEERGGIGRRRGQANAMGSWETAGW